MWLEHILKSEEKLIHHEVLKSKLFLCVLELHKACKKFRQTFNVISYFIFILLIFFTYASM